MRTEHRVWVYGHNVNTDVIFPGKYTYTLRTPEEIAAHALEDLDPSFAGAVQPGDVIIAGENWGCGSSREQAVTCLKHAGVPMIVAASFSRIYYRNCINQGVLPVIIPELHRLLTTGDTLTREGSSLLAAGQRFALPALPPLVERILAAGGLLPMLRAEFEV